MTIDIYWWHCRSIHIFVWKTLLSFHLITQHEEITSPYFGLWRGQWHPTPVLLPGKSCGQRSLVGCSPWGRYKSDTTQRFHFYFSLSCIGEGNGNPLQCSCLENPRERGAWWAAVYGVAQSRTRLKWLSSSSIQTVFFFFFLDLFIFLFLAKLGFHCNSWVFSSWSELSSCCLAAVPGFSLRWSLLLWSTGSRPQAQ